MNLEQKKIAVLMGGPGSERAVSMASAAGVSAALRSLGAEVFEVDVRDADFVLPENVDIAFNVIHGTFGEDGQIQRILEERGVPYTGEGVEVSRIAFDKILSKERFLKAGVPTAGYEILSGDALPTLPLPYVLKAPREGSSVGIAIVKETAAANSALREVRSHDHEVLVEEFFQGRELTVGILGAQALPIIEICPKEGFYDFKNKYPFLNPDGGATHYCPANLTTEESARVQRTALDAARALGLEVYGRADVLLAANGDLCVLEINTIPGMTETSLLPEAAAVVGIGYPELCDRIIALSLQRKEGA